jgi:amyloid beta precursor protein binding protein 1
VLQPVATAAHSQSIPLFYVHSTGFYARFSIQLPDYFPIVETHPDPVSTQDLRLLKPWPELLDFMKSKTDGLDAMSDHEHGHVPYLLLLLYHLEQWKQEHGQYPNSYKNKTAFRGKVQASARTSNAEGGEENFDEAAAAVLKSLSPPTVPSAVREIFNEPECKEPTADVRTYSSVLKRAS